MAASSEQYISKSESNIDMLLSGVLLGVSFDTIDRYGEAFKEHLYAYTGVDAENHDYDLKKGLRDIGEQKINPEYEKQNLKQQAGFAAELKYLARKNAEAKINRSNERVVATDLKKSGSYDELYDHYKMKNGKVISMMQMKFVGNDVKSCVDKLMSSNYQKYIDGNADFTLPADYFELDVNGNPQIQVEIDRRIQNLQKQIDSRGCPDDVAKKKTEAISKLKLLKERVKDSGITKDEAEFARNHPLLSTAGDLIGVSHRAGLDQSLNSAAIGGTVALAKNLAAYVQGKKDGTEATRDVIQTAGNAAAEGYAKGFLGSAFKGCLQNSDSAVLRGISKSNLPAAVVTLAVDTTKTITKFINGEIDGTECMEEIGKSGFSLVVSSITGTAGQILIPIPVLGAVMGSAVGYALSSACYGSLMKALKEAKLSRERRIRIEAECREHIRYIRQCRAELEKYFDDSLHFYKQSFHEAFIEIKQACNTGDSDGFICACNKLNTRMGGVNIQYSNTREFNELMNSDEPFNL